MKTSWILVLAAVAGLTACHRRAAAPAPPIRPVLSIVVAPEAAGGAAFAGTVGARYESILGFRVLGRMIARDVNVGDNVKQGARLAALDPLLSNSRCGMRRPTWQGQTLICRRRN